MGHLGELCWRHRPELWRLLLPGVLLSTQAICLPAALRCLRTRCRLSSMKTTLDQVSQHSCTQSSAYQDSLLATTTRTAQTPNLASSSVPPCSEPIPYFPGGNLAYRYESVSQTESKKAASAMSRSMPCRV